MSISTYLSETKHELAHVTWPTKKQSIVFSIVVIIVSLAVAFFLGFFDFLFSRLLSYFIG
jgi:preprotein translocase SecE subunit